jgi:hypothetical protein
MSSDEADNPTTQNSPQSRSSIPSGDSSSIKKQSSTKPTTKSSPKRARRTPRHYLSYRESVNYLCKFVDDNNWAKALDNFWYSTWMEDVNIDKLHVLHPQVWTQAEDFCLEFIYQRGVIGNEFIISVTSGEKPGLTPNPLCKNWCKSKLVDLY